MSLSTIFQTLWDGATAFGEQMCLAQGHNTTKVGIEHPKSRPGVRAFTTKPPRPTPTPPRPTPPPPPKKKDVEKSIKFYNAPL